MTGLLFGTVLGDLVQAPEDLMQRRAQSKLAFERIVFETTGLADPVPILRTLVMPRSLGNVLRIHGSLQFATLKMVRARWDPASRLSRRLPWRMVS